MSEDQQRQADAPEADPPTADPPTAEKPTAEEPTAEEPTAEKPTADEPTAEEPTAEEPTAEKLTAAAAKESWRPQLILGTLPAYGMALLSGVLYFLAYPGIDIWPLSLVALAPLIVAMRGQSVRRATALAWVSGITMNMLGFYWLLGMLRVFSGFPTVLCALIMTVLCAYQGGRIALCGLLYGCAERKGWPASLAFVAAFASSELLYPLLFPWYFGATVHNAPVLMQTADLGGPILVGLVLVAANLAVAEVASALLQRRPVDRRMLVVGAAVPLLAALYGVWRISSVDAQAQRSEAVKVGLVQGNSPLFQRDAALRIHQRLTGELKKQGADLVVWSEAAVAGLFSEKDYEKMLKRTITAKLGVPTIVGTVLHRELEPAPAVGRNYELFNTAVLTDAKGNVVGRYDKQFLLMFGEYLPFGRLFPKLYEWSPNSGRFSPGTSDAALVLGPHRYSVTICYEDIIPSFVNRLVRTGDPDLLVNMTNDAWFGDTTEPWIHLALAKMRAVEHRRYLVRATNSGVSAIVDPVGRVVAHSETFKEQTVLGTARYLRQRTGYLLLGNAPFWLLAALTVAGCVVRRPTRWPWRKRPASKS